jgi:hypothetical protein
VTEKREERKVKNSLKQRKKSKIFKTIENRPSKTSEELSTDWRQDTKISQQNSCSSLNTKNLEMPWSSRNK